ncbi:DEP domain-containing protein 1A-like [Styela clava]
MFQSTDVSQGPYRATKLWNEVVRLFRCGMPTKRHWHQFKVFHDTFTGAEAADWLHDCLKINNNFGAQVTREQTIRLLCKFLKNHVIEEVSGKWGTEEYTDNKQLYRFPIGVSPSKVIRQPLALLNTNQASPRQQNITNAKNKFIVQSRMKKNNHESPKTTSSVWQRAYMSSFQKLLNLKSIEEILPCGILHTEWLLHNVTKDELSTFTEHEMPYWVISAMQCLATWPNSESSGLPNYPGFERDIFSAVCGYFQALSEPLLTYNLYQLFITVFVHSEMLDEDDSENHSDKFHAKSSPQVENESEEEVEKLRRKLMQAQMRHANKAIRHHKSMRHGSMPAKYLNFNEVDVPAHFGSLPRWNWKLEDVATRETWNDRFASFRKLDELTEESSFQTKQENYASLPELRFSNTLPRPRSSHNNEAKVEKKISQHDKLTGFDYKTLDDEAIEAGFLPLDEEFKSRSVENLLLDMSIRMHDELENDLMKDNNYEATGHCNSNAGKNRSNPLSNTNEGYENLSFEKKDDFVDSPMYRTMKPIYEKNKKPQKQNTRFQSNFSTVKKCRSFNSRQIHSIDSNLSKEGVYMEISASQPSLNKASNMYLGGNLATLREPAKPSSQFQKIKEQKTIKRRSLKPSIEDLENDLMFSPFVPKPALPAQNNNGDQLDSKKQHPQSAIKERREVPPPCVTNAKKIDPHFIQQRLDRLPYVSQTMLPSKQHANSESQLHVGLTRSHSTLSYRPLREVSLDNHGNDRYAGRQSSINDRFSWNNKSMMSGAKSCNNFNEAFSQPQCDVPPSPLTTAFDSARTKANPITGASNRLVEALQFCLLLLPPCSRSKLRLLLRLITKMCNNPHLVDLHDLLSTRAFVLQELSPCIIRQRPVKQQSRFSMNKDIEQKIISVFLEHTSVLMDKPTSLEKTVKELTERTKLEAATNLTSSMKPIAQEKSMKRQTTFCKQVTVSEYEKQRRSNLESSLKQLLEDIVHSENMTTKEKRKKLKQFQKSYPEIYKGSYPNGDPLLDRRSSTRRKPMFSTAIKRLRSLRS